jgi:hypothetical protein
MKRSILLILLAGMSGVACSRDRERVADEVDTYDAGPVVSEVGLPGLDPASPLALPSPVQEQLQHPLYQIPEQAELYVAERDSAGLIEFGDEFSVTEKAAMTTRMVQFLDRNVPEFVIKLDATPWMDVRYKPLEVRIEQPESDMAVATIRFECQVWDEGEPLEPVEESLQLYWVDGYWLNDPDDGVSSRILSELSNAASTLAQEWAPGERPE